mmetsp:Transcript_41058/g.75120  ORF Transcript_41058/g.75120 Transcript_41058/m.75120 type:complete len:757 (-) Transcript_41058:139-2409(-)|eukprot:CAMPEP_0201878258 /NCGR_PEP_ID=MMETSP0902-20130614/9464_1 /ASSEMBLY_ACC=CAM_ASM_000551 /TAXON_ID=420261 /ORGANISM="Thalassiosira antarctica, Strain CCMP982" /LENGTH=756 /DNA_ID=CAMNT_0048405875 /DNA_START=179 /DNA_END=2449 /DNA_ORIENTATION=-
MPKSKNRKVSSDSDTDANNKSDDKAENKVNDQSANKDKNESKASTDTDPIDADDDDDGATAKENGNPPDKNQTSAGTSANDVDEADNAKSGDEENASEKGADNNNANDGNTKKKDEQTSPKKDMASSNENDEGVKRANDESNGRSEDDTTQQQQQQQQSNSKRQSSTSTNPSRASSNPVNNNNNNIRPNTTSATIATATATPTHQTQNTTIQTNTKTNNTSTMDDFDDDYSDSKDTLLTMTFNQDGGCLAVGTGSGFRICNANPFQETFRRSLGGGDDGGVVEGGAGIAHIEMLYRTNLLALTGHSTSPHYPPNKVLIYDDHLQRTIGELSFRQKVLCTKLRRDRIVVVLRDRVYIYNFSDLALLDKVHTGDNPLGLIGISMDNGGVGGSTTTAAGVVERAEDALGSAAAAGSVSGNGNGNTTQRNNGMVLACPSTQRGQVRVELYGLRRTTTVVAHESALGALALSVDGSLLATASERGTVIRLFDTRGVTIGGGGGGSNGTGGAKHHSETTSVSSSVPLREFRRGVERATISCLTFSLDSNWLGCASNHGTVHIFQTQDPTNNDASAAAKKKKSSYSMTGKAMRLLPKLVTAPKKYLMDGEQSYAQVRGVPHPRACAFVPDRERTIAVAGMDEYGNGCLLLAEFGSKTNGNGSDMIGESSNSKMENDSSEARRLGYHRFFKCKSPASQCGSGSRSSRRTAKSSKDGKYAEDAVVSAEGGAYIDDAPVDMRMNHISIGDENEDHFVPIDYNIEES